MEVLNIISILIQIILFITLIVLVISLFGYTKRLTIKVELLQDDVNKFVSHAEPLIDDTRKFISILHDVTDKVNDNMDVLKGTVERIKNTVDSVLEFEQRIQTKIESPVMDSINTYSAIIKGITVFFERIKENKYKTFRKSRPEIESPKGNYNEDDIIFDDEIQEEFNDINKELNEVRKKLEEMKKV